MNVLHQNVQLFEWISS